jgi:hypothetical protein
MGKKYDHDVLLRWRTQLTDFEKDTLIPQFAERLEKLVEMFNEMLGLVNDAEKDPAFIEAIQRAINPTNLKMDDKQVLPHVMYCSKIRKQIQESFLKPISTVQILITEIDNYRTFAKFINEIMIVAMSVSQNESTLFWLSLKPFAHVVDPKTEKLLATTEPVEYAIILRPFDVLAKNLNQLAKGIIGTVDAWTKEQSNWKTQYLSFRSNESIKANNLVVFCINISTVFVAVAVSSSFLFLPDLWTSKKETDQLKAEKQITERALEESKDKINILEAQLKKFTEEK